MKKITLIAIAAAVLLGFIFFKLLNPANIESAQIAGPSSASKNIREISEESVAIEEIKSTSKESDFRLPNPSGINLTPTPACENQWFKISSASLNQLRADLKQGVFEFDSECLQFEKQNDVMRRLYEACSYSRQDRQLKDQLHCFKELTNYRMAWMDRLTYNRTDYHSMSLSLLLNKLFARMKNPQISQEENAKALEMARVLAERESEWGEAHKFLIAATLTQSKWQPELLEEIEALAERGLQVAPEDMSLIEIRLLASQLKNDSGYVQSFVEAHPDVGLGYYYRARAHLGVGDKTSAIQDLKQAIALMPNESRFKETLMKVESGETQNAFVSKISSSIEDI